MNYLASQGLKSCNPKNCAKIAPKGTTTTTLNFKYINIITPIWPCLIILFSVELFNAAIQCSQDTLIFYSFPPWPGRLPLNCKKIENKIFSCVSKGLKKPHSVSETFLKDSSFNFTYELQVWIKCAYMCIYVYIWNFRDILKFLAWSFWSSTNEFLDTFDYCHVTLTM